MGVVSTKSGRGINNLHARLIIITTPHQEILHPPLLKAARQHDGRSYLFLSSEMQLLRVVAHSAVCSLDFQYYSNPWFQFSTSIVENSHGGLVALDRILVGLK